MSSRQRMISSMSQLLQQKEINTITVQNIIDNADFSRGTFYAHFTDKYDVMNAYFRDETKKHMENIHDAPWVTMLTSGATFMQQNRNYFLTAFKSTGQNSFNEFWFADSLVNVTDGVKYRAQKTTLTDQEEQASRFFVAGYMQLMRDWIEQDTPTTPEKIAETIYAFMPAVIKINLW
ncbi:TetR/AcrR family transcriptional regulator C-terminal domain-containing protein [Lactiplantibacillus herbarum]|uniref:TetR/AcrR family transcriptional regulator C-terminal domain-containing protein n=1 Tax=Lactiplantibacillus herbarum TaxID=1670446 RepID=UPI00064E6328|nr:TetR/AcrR family transcriptional regulator C-terminal domain-containing protein [Lactiplantibacillus herbarum]